MTLFKKVSLVHEEFVVCVFGKEIPISAIKTGLLGSFIIMVALMSYFEGEWMQQQTMNWFAFYSGNGMCNVMNESGGHFIVVCDPDPRSSTLHNFTNFSLGNIT